MTKLENCQSHIKIANFGGGVNSVAGIIKYGIESFDEVIFADTGSEKPETYEYLKYLVEHKGWKITVVDKSYHWNMDLYDYYIKQKSFPSPSFRDCTAKFKINPMRRYLRKKYGKNVHFDVYLFIDYSEIFRMKTSDVQYQTLHYPLIDDKIDREGCIQIIKDAGFLVPSKSSCFMCPFNTPKQWLKLKDQHPDLFDKSVALENIRGPIRNKKYRLINISETLKDGNQSCLTGYCMS